MCVIAVAPVKALQIVRRNKRSEQQKARRQEGAASQLCISNGMKWDLTDRHLAAAVRGDVPITANMLEIQIKGSQRKGVEKKRQHLTSRGQIVAAVRKCLANIAASDFGKILMTDLSKDSFLRAEIVLGATRVASFRSFHDTHDSSCCIATHSYSKLSCNL